MPALTLGDIARQHGVDKDRVAYVIESRGIEPIGRAGHYRLFDQAAADEIGREIEQIAAE